ncbi:MAG: antitoxin VbhA family protein [Clostridiales bacterium]|nr:antitoxin VbhA family protein [Clostridiales bacterium]
MSNDLALANAIASVQMEGLYLSDEGYELCRRYSNNELSWSEFLDKALELVNEQE